MIYLILLFVIWKAIDTSISILAPHFIPYLGFFSYPDTMLKYGLPAFLRGLSNFDGIFYIRIALNGYSQYEQAYFPLFPILIKFVTPIFGNNPIIAGVFISNIAFLIGLFILVKYLKLINLPEIHLRWFLCFLIFFPTSFFFGVIYTESLYFLLLILTLYFLKKGYFFPVLISTFLAGLTRITGAYLLIPIFFSTIKDFNLKKIVNIKIIAMLSGPILGLSSYCFYLWRTTGDPIYFFHAQEYFGAHRSSHLIFIPQVLYRYLKIFLTAQWNFQYFVSLVELIFFLGVALILFLDLRRIILKRSFYDFRFGLNLFSWVNLIVPTLTGTLTAIPRYSMMSISIYFFLSEIKSTLLKSVLLFIFVILHIIFLALFIQGYYVT